MTSLPGRETQLTQLEELVTEVSRRSSGAAVAVVGEAGSGKTAVLDVVENRARELGFLILRAAGLVCETGTPGAGLHELLHAVLHRATDLAPDRRAVLDACFGRQEDEPVPHRL